MHFNDVCLTNNFTMYESQKFKFHQAIINNFLVIACLKKFLLETQSKHYYFLPNPTSHCDTFCENIYSRCEQVDLTKIKVKISIEAEERNRNFYFEKMWKNKRETKQQLHKNYIFTKREYNYLQVYGLASKYNTFFSSFLHNFFQQNPITII